MADTNLLDQGLSSPVTKTTPNASGNLLDQGLSGSGGVSASIPSSVPNISSASSNLLDAGLGIPNNGQPAESKMPPQDENAPWYRKAGEWLNTPLVDFNHALSPEGAIGKAFGRTSEASGFERGAENIVSGLTSPLSIALTLGTFGTGGLLESAGMTALKESGEFGAEELPQILKAAQTAVDTYKAAPEGTTAIADAVKASGVDPALWNRAQSYLYEHGLSEHDLLGGNLLERGAFQVLRKTVPDIPIAATVRAAKTANTLMNAGFTLQQLESASAMSPRFLDALKEGDYDKAMEYGTEVFASGALGVLGTSHALHSAGELFKPLIENDAFRPNDHWLQIDRANKEREAQHAVAEQEAINLDRQTREILGHAEPGFLETVFGGSEEAKNRKNLELATVFHNVVTGGDRVKAAQWYNALSEALGREDRLPVPGEPGPNNGQVPPAAPNEDVQKLASNYTASAGIDKIPHEGLLEEVPIRAGTKVVHSNDAGEVRVGEDGRPVVWLDPTHWAQLTRMFPSFEGTSGGSFSPAEAERIISSLVPNNPVKELFSEAQKASKQRLLTTSRTPELGNEPDKPIRVAAEELQHTWQRELSQDGEIATHLNPEQWNRLSDILPKGQTTELNKYGYSSDPVIRVAETAAKFRAGIIPETVSPIQATQWLNEYYKEVKAKHGDNFRDEAFKINEIARQHVKDIYDNRRARQVSENGGVADAQASRGIPERLRKGASGPTGVGQEEPQGSSGEQTGLTSREEQQEFDKLSRLRLRGGMGDPNSAGLVTGDNEVLVGRYHDDLAKEAGYKEPAAGKGNIHDAFFRDGGVRIRGAGGVVHIDFMDPNADTFDRVYQAVKAVPDANRYYVDFRPPKGSRAVGFNISAYDKDNLLFQLKDLEEGKQTPAPMGSVAYFRNGLFSRDYNVKETDDPEKFYEAINKVKEAHAMSGADKQLTVYSPKEYAGMRTFLSPDGKTGFALKGDDIVSVFSHPTDTPGAAAHLLDVAVRNGGRRLDAMDTYLPKVYAREGFKVVARMPWNDAYAPKGWDYNAMKQYNNGRPDIVFMAYDPEHASATGGVPVRSYAEAENLQKEAIDKAQPALVGSLFSRERENETPQWYLKSNNLIDQRMQGPMPADTVLKMLENNGVKPDELKYTGLAELLHDKGKEPVRPEELKKFLDANNLQVQEVTHGGLSEIPKDWEVRHDPNYDTYQVYNGQGRPVTDQGGRPFVAYTREEALRQAQETAAGPTKFGSYTLPGGPLSRDTEILTNTGWKRIDSVEVGDVVLTRKDSGELEWQPVQDTPSVFAENLYWFKNQSVNMQVTDHHQMVVKRRRRSKEGVFRTTAKELWNMSECLIPLTGQPVGSVGNETLFGLDAGDVAEFVGWYLAEGSAKTKNGKKTTLQIAQSQDVNKEKCSRLELLFDRLGVSWSYYGEAYGVGIRKMPLGLKELLHDQPLSDAKYVPSIFFEQSSSVINRLLEGLILGDGTTVPAKGSRQQRKYFFSKSETLAGGVQALLALVGKRASVRRRRSGLYVVGINTKQWASVDDAKHSIVPYNDTAFCVTVENHAIYVRREGVAAFTGNSNYREMLLTLPKNVPSREADAAQARLDASNFDPRFRAATQQTINDIRRRSSAEQEFRSSHWDEPNVVGHVRFNDRVGPNGEKLLHLEELQSDWHQKGRQQGYQESVPKEALDYARARTEETRPAANEALRKVDYLGYDTPSGARGAIVGHPDWAERWDVRDLSPQEIAAINEWRQAHIDQTNLAAKASSKIGVPDAPFKKTWPELLMKRMIRYAAENGYDGISWTPGEEQAARYDLSKHISRLEYDPHEENLRAWDKSGDRVIDEDNVTRDKLPEFIGKDAADRLLAKVSEWEHDSGSGLSVVQQDNGEGRFYLADGNGEPFYNKSGQVETYPTRKAAETNLRFYDEQQRRQTPIPELRGLDLKVGGEGMHGFYDKIVPEMANKLGKQFGAKVGETKIDTIPGGAREFGDVEDRKENPDFKKKTVPYFPITDSMRESVMKQGQPLFSRESPNNGQLQHQIDTNVFKNQPKDYQDLVMDSLRRNAMGELSDREIQASKKLRDEQDRNYEIGSSNDLLHHYIEDYMTRVYKDTNPEGRVILSNAKGGRFATNVTMAKQRVYDSNLTALLKSPKQMLLDPVQITAQGRASLIKAAANRQLIDSLRDKFTRASDGRPAVVLSGSGQVVSGQNGEDPSIFVDPNRVRKINIDPKVIEQLSASGDLDRYLANGTIRDITPYVRPNNIGAAIDKLEEQAQRKTPIDSGPSVGDWDHLTLSKQIAALEQIRDSKNWGALKEINDSIQKKYAWDPQDYVSLANNAMKGWNFITNSPDGTPVYVRSDIKVHPEFAEYLQNRLGLAPSEIAKHPIGKALLGAGSKLKQTLLSLSPFHLVQEALRGIMVGVNPFHITGPDILSGEKIDPNDPNSPTIIRKAVENGFTTGTDYKSLQAHSEGLSSGGGILDKIPGVGKVIGNSLNWYQDFLFKRYIPALKARSVELMYHEYQRLHPDWSMDRIAKAAAMHANDTFGGINWKAMGRSATTQDWGRLMFLAPDWLESEMRSGARLFNKEEGGLGRAQVAKMALGLWGIARVLNLVTTGNAHYEAPFGLATKNKEGKETIFSIRTLPTDLLHAASDPVGFIKGRLSPAVRTGEELVSGRDQFGRKLQPQDLWVDVFRNMAPIPLQAVGQALSGQGPEIGNFGQAVKAVGGTAMVYRTPAQKMAADLAADHTESGPVDPAQMARHHRILQLEDQARAGEISWPDLYKLTYATDQLKPDELKKIETNVKETKGMDPSMAALYSRASRLPAKDYLDLLDVMNNSEKAALASLTLKVQKRYLLKARKNETPEERAKDPVFQRFMQMIR